MTQNTRLSIKMLGSAISIVLISCIAIPAAIAQPTSPSPSPSQATPPPNLSQNNYNYKKAAI